MNRPEWKEKDLRRRYFSQVGEHLSTHRKSFLKGVAGKSEITYKTCRLFLFPWPFVNFNSFALCFTRQKRQEGEEDSRRGWAVWSLRGMVGMVSKMTSNCLPFYRNLESPWKSTVEFSSTTLYFYARHQGCSRTNGLGTGHFAEGHCWMVSVHLDLTYFPLSFCSLAPLGIRNDRVCEH